MLVPELQRILEAFQSRIATGNLSVETVSDKELLLTSQVPDTFPITITFENPGDIVVRLAPWHEHLTSTEQATNLAIWLLTPYYRIVAMYSGGQLISSHCEIYRNEGWEASETVYFANPEEGLPDPDEIRIRHQAVFLDSSFPRFYLSAELDGAGFPVGTLLGETIYHLKNGEWHPTNVPDMPE